MSEQEAWASVDDVAKHLGIVKDTVYRWIESKGMPAHKVGRLWKFKLSQVDAWIEAGEREVKKALRGTLFKYKLHSDKELFEKAYGYIVQYY